MPRGVLGKFRTLILREFPDHISSEDRERLVALENVFDYSIKIPVYEELAERYAHPFFYAQAGCMLGALEARSLMIRRLQQAQISLRRMHLSDAYLDSLLDMLPLRREDVARRTLSQAKTIRFHQPWRPATLHRFPSETVLAHSQLDALRLSWASLDGASRARYIRRMLIESLQIEDVFALADIRGLVHLGFEYGDIKPTPRSRLQSILDIRNILNDSWKTYVMLEDLAVHWRSLDRTSICALHARLMHSCRFSGGRHITIGETRSFTFTTVVVGGQFPIEMCPFHLVDAELQTVCDLIKCRLAHLTNPLACASWAHLLLARCHPFEDGNGRIARLLASIPLLLHGYPPFTIMLSQRMNYYDAINQAHDGDHTAFAQCMLQGIGGLLATL